MKTKNCVRCFKPAKFWGGHVLTSKKKKITAGWCGERCKNLLGFCGHLKREMGVEK